MEPWSKRKRRFMYYAATRGGAGSSAPVSQAISAIDATGWQSAMTVPVDLALEAITGTRQGYTNAGATTTYSGTWYTTKRVRQPYPNQASLTTDTVAMDDYVYSTDTLPGVTNSSAETSPKPAAQWLMTDRRVVGNSLTLEIAAFHRNAQEALPVACVVFRATDGSNTVETTVTTPTVLGGTGDLYPVVGYTGTLDITSLTAGQITANAKVYPWIGAAASVLDSADNTNLWDFSPRTFTKNTTLAATPYIVYVAAGGNDATGAVSQTDATAAASPCLTLHGALNRARTVLGTGAGALDGLRVRLTAGTWSFTSSPTSNTVNAEIVIEPATGQSKATVTFNFGAVVGGNARTTYVRLRDLTIVRNGAQPIHNVGSGAGCVVENCTYDNATFANATVGGTGGGLITFINCTLTNMLASTLNAGTTQIVRMLRGVTASTSGGATNISLEHRCVVGSKLTGFVADNTAGRTLTNVVVAYNYIQGGNTAAGLVQLNTPTPVTNCAIVQNIIEYYTTSSNYGVSVSSDNSLANTSHVIMWHNTHAGFNIYGRGNLFYDDTTGTLRTHKLHSMVGNIHVQVNTKSDVFKLDGTRVGAWSYMYGVGSRGEFSRYRDANGGGLGTSFAQEYPGLNYSYGTTNTAPGNDPLFTSYQAVTSGPVAGAGNGTYTIGALSPAKSLVTASPIPFDFAGSARSGTVAAGAYV